MKNGVKANSAQTDMWFKWFDNWKIGGSLPRLQWNRGKKLAAKATMSSFSSIQTYKYVHLLHQNSINKTKHCFLKQLQEFIFKVLHVVRRLKHLRKAAWVLRAWFKLILCITHDLLLRPITPNLHSQELRCQLFRKSFQTRMPRRINREHHMGDFIS